MTSEPLPPPPPAAATPWRRRAKRVGIVFGVVLTCVALLCCAGVAYVAYNANRAPREQNEMEAFANDLCRDLLGGDADAVYAALSAQARDRYSAQELAGGLTTRHLAHCVVVLATYLFLLVAYVVIEDDNGQHSFDLVKEDDRWKVDSDILHDLDSPTRHGGGGGFGD